VLERDVARFRRVTLGGERSGRVVVKSGLSDGEIVQSRAAALGWRSKTPKPDANSVAPPVGGWDSDIVADTDRQALVQTIQTLLVGQGFDPGPADGRVGPKTRQAVKDYQRKVGMPETGNLDGELLAALSAVGR